MGKKKSAKKRRSVADNVVQGKSNKVSMAASTMANNPFEFKLNRDKHDVLNRRQKHARGKPGVSRSKALQKRKETLLEEYRTRNKANAFVDRRLGENNTDMSLEDKMMVRFAAERKSHHEKGNIYNLNDDEDLTHRGQSLVEIEKFEDPRSDDEDDDYDKVGDKLEAGFVKSAHFGGFLTRKDDDNGEQDKSRQELIDEMIAKSKQKKHERQSEKEATEEMTEKVDAEWSTVRSLLTAFQKSSLNTEEGGQKAANDYDVVVRELKFDIRAKPTDRLKTPEEFAKDEKEKLETLEADRLHRMTGIRDDDLLKTNAAIGDHKSADDLDDSWISSKKKDKRNILTNKDNELEQDDSQVRAHVQKKKVTFVDDKRSTNKSSVNDDDESENEESESDDDGQESDDSYADILSEAEDDSELKANEIEDNQSVDRISKIKSDLKERKILMDSARKELPYTFTVPETFEDFINLIDGHSTDDQLIILERLIKCHHPYLSDTNLEKLDMVFVYMLRWIDNLASIDEPAFGFLDGLVPILYDLVQLSPMNSSNTMLDIVLKKQNDFQSDLDRKNNGNAKTPPLSTLIVLKLVVILFPASDFSHPVVTPALLFMGQILIQSTISSCRDVAVCLFVCHLFLECVSLSKRFVPEAVNFLIGCFLSSLPLRDGLPFVHPFKPVGPTSELLCVNGDCKDDPCLPLSMLWLKCDDVITDNFRILALYVCISLLRRFAELYVGMPSFPITFNPIVRFYIRLPFDKLPATIKLEVEKLVELLTQHTLTFKLTTMVRERRKPKPMKLLDPIIEEQFDGRRRRSGDPVLLDKQRFQHRFKREMKGAIREIRRDNQFLAKQKFMEQQQRDDERKRKLKEIYQDLASQEGFCKTIERKKMKK